MAWISLASEPKEDAADNTAANSTKAGNAGVPRFHCRWQRGDWPNGTGKAGDAQTGTKPQAVRGGPRHHLTRLRQGDGFRDTGNPSVATPAA